MNKKVKHYRISIFTEEYKIDVVLGNEKDSLTKLSNLLGDSKSEIASRIKKNRGYCWDIGQANHCTIWVDDSLPYHIAIATLAHESSHAMSCIQEFIGMNDKNDEFRAHGIACVMRTVGKDLRK